jgi:hypothetical protein
VNPADGRPVAVERRRVRIDHSLPMRDAYSAFVLSLAGQA